MLDCPRVIENYPKVRIVRPNIPRAQQMAPVPQPLQCSTVTPPPLIWLCMGPIVMVVEHCKIVDQSPKIGPMLVREMCSDIFSSSVSKDFLGVQEEILSDHIFKLYFFQVSVKVHIWQKLGFPANGAKKEIKRRQNKK